MGERGDQLSQHPMRVSVLRRPIDGRSKTTSCSKIHSHPEVTGQRVPVRRPAVPHAAHTCSRQHATRLPPPPGLLGPPGDSGPLPKLVRLSLLPEGLTLP